MRLGARLDQVIEAIARGEKPFLKRAITEVYEEAWREGRADGIEEGRELGYQECRRDLEEREDE